MNRFKRLSSNQHYALVVLVFSIVYTILGFQIESGFFTDPIGSALWVQGVGFCLIALSILLFFFSPAFEGKFPAAKEWLSRIPFIATVVLYAELLPLIGFFVTTPILITLVGLFFGARLVPAIVSALLMTLACYVIFDVLLGISLPVGLYFK